MAWLFQTNPSVVKKANTILHCYTFDSAHYCEGLHVYCTFKHRSHLICLNLSLLKTQLENYYYFKFSISQDILKIYLFVNYRPAAPCYPFIKLKFHIPVILHEQILRIDFLFILPKNTLGDLHCKPNAKKWSLPNKCHQKPFRHNRKFLSNSTSLFSSSPPFEITHANKLIERLKIGLTRRECKSSQNRNKVPIYFPISRERNALI